MKRKLSWAFIDFASLFLAFTMIKPVKLSAPMHALQKQNQNEDELMT